MNELIATVMVIAAGVVLYLYVYHWQQRDYADSKNENERIQSVRPYGMIDRIFKIYTPPLVAACLLMDHPLLLEIHNNPYLIMVGLAVSAIGLGLFLWSMRTLGTRFSPCEDAYVPNSVVTTGPYRYVRHPVYSSNLVLVFGLFLLTGSLWIVGNLVIMLIFYGIAISREEAALCERFTEYRDHCKVTGRLLPRLRFWNDG